MPLDPKQQPPYYTPGTGGSNASIKVYRAILNQTSTAAPIPQIIQNTLGDITWARTGQGVYTGTLTGEFPINNTWLQITNSPANNIYVAVTKRLDDNTIEYATLLLQVPAQGQDGGTVFIDIQVKQ